MLYDQKISWDGFSDLEKKFDELNRIQQDLLKSFFDAEMTKIKILEKKTFAEIEARVYSGIKKYFK